MMQRLKVQTRRQSFVSAIAEAGAHLPLSKRTIDGLAKFSVNADEVTNATLITLLSQPDPRGSLAGVLPYLLREAQADYTNADEADFAQWVRTASFCFHDVDDLTVERRGVEKPTGSDYVPSRFVQGAFHYRENGENYSDEQIAGLVLISAAAHSENLASPSSQLSINEDGRRYRTDYTGHEHFWCHSVRSQKIIEVAVSSPEAAEELLRIIQAHRVYTEHHILHLLHGGPASLVNGAL